LQGHPPRLQLRRRSDLRQEPGLRPRRAVLLGRGRSLRSGNRQGLLAGAAVRSRCHGRQHLPAQALKSGYPAPVANAEAPRAEGMGRVYGAAPDAFTKERDALARELKAAGRTAASAAVKALKKPSRSAWAVDQLARRFPDRIGALLKAGDELAATQRRA